MSDEASPVPGLEPTGPESPLPEATVTAHDTAGGDQRSDAREASVETTGGPGESAVTDVPETAGDPAEAGDTSEPGERAGRRRRPVIEWVAVVVIALLAAMLIRSFVVQQFEVSGTSMVPTLHDGDRVLVNKLSYRMHDPRRGDVVVLKTLEGANERDLIKRVIALPGETIEYRDCRLYIDGRLLEEPYLDPTVVTPLSCGGSVLPTVIEPRRVFVMGDNRGGSKDSRVLGQIAFDDLLGRAFVVLWPIKDWKSL